MKYNITTPHPVLYIVFAFFTFLSCAKDNDLFLETTLEEKEIEEIVEENTDSETETEETQNAEENNSTENEDENIPVSGDNVYFVTVDGSGSNDGKSEINSWSLSHAFNTAKAGDIIYVKAGLYKNFRTTQNNNGLEDMPIRFLGYKSSPGDINPKNQYDYTLGPQTIKLTSNFAYGDTVDSSKMPLLQESNTTSAAINIRGSYVQLYNFQFLNYGYHIINSGDYNKFENIISIDTGDLTSTSYSGYSIYNNGNYSEWKNIYVENGGAQGFSIRGNHNIFDAVSVVSDNQTNATDYYFLFQQGNNNVASNIYIKNYAVNQHYGHGIVFKTPEDCSNNTVNGFIIDDSNLEAQYPGVHNNHVKNGYVIKNRGGQLAGGMRLINGSYENLFENIILDGMGIYFADWNGDMGGNVAESSDNNNFNQITVINAAHGVSFNYFEANHNNAYPENNTFYNCTFYNISNLFEDSRKNVNTKFVNCIFSNINGFKQAATGYSSKGVDVYFENSSFHNIKFTLPNGLDISSFNTEFVNPSDFNFSLIEGSPLKGIGKETPYLNQGNDLGSFQ